MRDIFSFFQGTFNLFKSISKQMYRNCAIIASGATLVAVAVIGSGNFGGNGKSGSAVAYAQDAFRVYDEEADEEADEELIDLLSGENNLSLECGLLSFDLSDYVKQVEVCSDLITVTSYNEEKANILTLSGGVEPEVASDVKTLVVSCSEEDYDNLVRIIEAEATDLDVYAKILVADVVINRVRSCDFPNTISEVIFQDNGEQFMPVADGRFYSLTPTESSYEAASRALYGEDYSEGALFFATYASSGEGSFFASNLKRLFDYNGHVFFGYY